MRDVVIIDGIRTPFGRMGGGLKDIKSVELAGITIKKLIEKCSIENMEIVDSVFSGSAAGDLYAANFSRYASLIAGLPYKTSALFTEMQCGSAIAAINTAALYIGAGKIDVAICGGGETYSQSYRKISTSNKPYRDLMPAPVNWRLSPLDEDNIPMIQVSDLMAKMWNISREECDEFAFYSQQKAKKAMDLGYLEEEVFTVYDEKGNVLLERDEHLRPDTTLEGLRKLKAVGDGVTTAGNASGRNDGSAYILMMSADFARRNGFKPKAKWVDGADIGVDPKIMGIGPAYSNQILLERNGLKISDLGVIECNEAFAAQNLSVIKEMEKLSGEKIDPEIWNPNGGAIAIGHPNGASGARICIAAMNEIKRKNREFAIFSTCCGGGIGVSALIQNI